MSDKKSNLIKLIVGIAISAAFLYLAIAKSNAEQMKQAFQQADVWLILLTIPLMFVAHWLRALRWQMFLRSIKSVPISRLLSATLIGYMGNTVLPAHLGEVFWANVVGNREGIPTSSILATLVIERIIDVMSLLAIMLVAVFIYPFPDLVILSGYVMFFVMSGAFLFLFLLKRRNPVIIRLLNLSLKMLPQKLAKKLESLIGAFIDGIRGMAHWQDYVILFLLSLAIWFFYWLNLHLVLYAFNLVAIYHLTIISSVVLLVTTTISVVVPSSPGYVGTYHYLGQLSLELFGVPGPVGLSYIIVAHAVSMIPTALAGFILAWKEGIDRLNRNAAAVDQGK
jgi:hypothetical protein